MKVLLFAALLLALTTLAQGQNKPAPEELPPLNETYGTFKIQPLYNPAEAYAGGTFQLKFIITADIANKHKLEIVECAPEDTPSPLRIRASGTTREDAPAALLESTGYSYLVTIEPNAEPRNYPIKLVFHYPDQEVITRSYNLNVGVRSRGKLSIVQDEEELEPPTFFTGDAEAHYLLTLRNDFADYAITVTKISVESIPESLVEFTDNSLAQPITLKPSEQRKVELRFKINGMNFTSLVSGFGDSPKLKLNLTYNDGYGREITDFTHKLNVKIRPRDSVLVLAMLSGVLMGGLIRFYLEFLARRKRITRREMLKFVIYTMIFGMVVTAFAFFGQIQIIAFKTNGSYDKPMALFIIGLAGAVGGLQLFVGWYNSLKPAAEEEKEKEKPATKRRRKREPTEDEAEDK
ncbi:MAG: hypothetical protein JOZ52_14355 [Acidobacteria bacterium]|nr:hypothetical protein [Acidobacteriota bacterium]